ncbi:MAG TPA: hypothetical protein VHZ55_27985 [Bryobacteraceae bacterium]|nr:hypothetical protein [Bryobacteraceae bacterium]
MPTQEDGLVGSLAGILTSPKGLSLTDAQVTAAATTYLAGAFLALFFLATSRTASAASVSFSSLWPSIPSLRWPAPFPGVSGPSQSFGR